MDYTFDQIKEAVNECTGYDLVMKIDEFDDPGYALIDGCGDQDGDLFYELDDVLDYVTNNDQVADYLADITA